MKVQVDSNGKVYLTSQNKVLEANGYNGIPKYEIYGTSIVKTSVNVTNKFSSVEVIQNGAMNYAFSENTTVYGILNFDNLASIDQRGLAYAFYGADIYSASFPELLNVAGNGLDHCFYNCYNFTSVSFPKLTHIGVSGLAQCFYKCGITSVSFPELTKVEGNGMASAFTYCPIKTASFPKLKDLQYTACLSNLFNYCTALEDVYFYALNTGSFTSNYTNQLSGLMQYTGNTINHNVHFPSNMQTTISGLTGYPLFGGTSGKVTLLFDLPATS